MINNSVIRNCLKPFPIIQGLVNEHALGKIKIKKHNICDEEIIE